MGLQLNFGRGRQMIVHDLRLDNPNTNPPTRLDPPNAFNVRRCQKSDATEHVIINTASIAKAAGTLDALHFMAHGFPGKVEVGSAGLSFTNADLFKSVAGHVRWIVLFSCSVGEGTRTGYSVNFGNAISAYAKCPCIACYATQWYRPTAANMIDFGEFEKNRAISTQKTNVKALNKDINLEKLIFG